MSDEDLKDIGFRYEMFCFGMYSRLTVFECMVYGLAFGLQMIAKIIGLILLGATVPVWGLPYIIWKSIKLKQDDNNI